MSQSQYVRLSILRQLLGEDAFAPIVADLPEDQRTRCEAIMREVSDSPPSHDEVDSVLHELQDLLKLTDQFVGQSESDVSCGSVNEVYGDSVEELDDPVARAERLHPVQLTAALAEESPRTICILLGSMSPERAADVLSRLNEKLRREVFLSLQSHERPGKELRERVAMVIAEKAVTYDVDELEAAQENNDERIAKLLRNIGREKRTELLGHLEESDPQAVQRIFMSLYKFDDIALLDNKTIQRLLTEIDTPTLTKSLKHAAPDVVDRVLGNLSSRAKATLLEEMEFTDTIAPAERNQAEEIVVKAMAALDQNGELTMVN